MLNSSCGRLLAPAAPRPPSHGPQIPSSFLVLVLEGLFIQSYLLTSPPKGVNLEVWSPLIGAGLELRDSKTERAFQWQNVGGILFRDA